MPSSPNYWLATLQIPSLNVGVLLRLFKATGSLERLFQATHHDWRQLQLPPALIQALQTVNWRSIDADVVWCEQHQVDIITWESAQYPALLRHLYDPPLVLFARGNTQLLQQQSLAVVGARRATHAGLATAFRFANTLALQQQVIVSGLALGIDAAAHKGALAAGNATTIAVLGSGLAELYPKQHTALARSLLCQEGLLLTEFLPHTKPYRYNFPRRNRIISGLARAVLVVEAAKKSGSLITADFALEQGRDVFAIPGSINNPLAQGCHRLIQQGAYCVHTVDDILQSLGLSMNACTTQNQMAPARVAPSLDAQRCLAVIDYQPTPVAEIIQRLNGCLADADVHGHLLTLECDGHIQVVPGGYIRNSM